MAVEREANRRLDRIMLRVQLSILGAALIWGVLPPLCMWLAGGVPA